MVTQVARARSHLPEIAPQNPRKNARKTVAQLCFTPFEPLVLVLAQIFATKVLTHIDGAKLKAIGSARAEEYRQQVVEIAKSRGFKNAEKIELVVGKRSFISASAMGVKTLEISPEVLIRPEDLPGHLDLKRLERGEISEKQWLKDYVLWLEDNPFFTLKKHKKKSQFIEMRKEAYAKIALDYLKDPKLKASVDEFIIGHEVGHLKAGDSLKKLLVHLGIHAVAAGIGGGLFALGLFISGGGFVGLFIAAMVAIKAYVVAVHAMQAKIVPLVSRKAETLADRVAAKSLNARLGGVDYFKKMVSVNLKLKKRFGHHRQVASRYTDIGDNRMDKNHPPLTLRIQRLGV